MKHVRQTHENQIPWINTNTIEYTLITILVIAAVAIAGSQILTSSSGVFSHLSAVLDGVGQTAVVKPVHDAGPSLKEFRGIAVPLVVGALALFILYRKK